VTGKAVLIYDADCPLCRRAAAWAEQRALPDALIILHCGSLEQLRAHPEMLQEQCEAAPQLVLPDGSVLEGNALLPSLLDRLHGWRWLAWAMRAPGLAWLAPLVYRTLIINKRTMAVLVYRK
jgi:predicted DCC family thiol-disulfide oxidoreductase YuxK